MKKVYITIVFLIGAASLFAQVKQDAWSAFAKTKFESRYSEKIGEYVFYPTFPAELKAMEGKEITIQGFYVPFAPEDGNYIIISKYPMSQCYFCGGGGPESVIEVSFAKTPAKFQVDDLIAVKGKLKLNVDNGDHVTFIVTDAVVISK